MAALDFPRRCISCMVRLIFQKFSDQICTISVIGNARIKKKLIINITLLDS